MLDQDPLPDLRDEAELDPEGRLEPIALDRQQPGLVIGLLERQARIGDALADVLREAELRSSVAWTKQ